VWRGGGGGGRTPGGGPPGGGAGEPCVAWARPGVCARVPELLALLRLGSRREKIQSARDLLVRARDCRIPWWRSYQQAFLGYSRGQIADKWPAITCQSGGERVTTRRGTYQQVINRFWVGKLLTPFRISRVAVLALEKRQCGAAILAGTIGFIVLRQVVGESAKEGLWDALGRFPSGWVSSQWSIVTLGSIWSVADRQTVFRKTWRSATFLEYGCERGWMCSIISLAEAGACVPAGLCSGRVHVSDAALAVFACRSPCASPRVGDLKAPFRRGPLLSGPGRTEPPRAAGRSCVPARTGRRARNRDRTPTPWRGARWVGGWRAPHSGNTLYSPARGLLCRLPQTRQPLTKSAGFGGMAASFAGPVPG